MKGRPIVVVMSLGMSVGATAWAQSLGELAQQEKERRAAKAQEGQASSKVARAFTQEDVQTPRLVETAQIPEVDLGKLRVSAPSSGPSGLTSEAARATQEGQWRSRFEAILKDIDAAERELAVQKSLVGGQVPELTRLTNAKERLASAKRSLEVLEEEARQKGIPPGWVR
jgi:hypothetical protein